MNGDKILGFIGGGNMARAIALGILQKGLVDKSQLIVSAPSEGTIDRWVDLSIRTTSSNAEVIRTSDVVILAFKPHQLDTALSNAFSDLKESSTSKLFISVLAGISCDVLYDKLYLHSKIATPFVKFRVIRAMPNTLALICEACTAIAIHSSATAEDIRVAQDIFSALGKCEVVPENLIPAITGLSGSGPAYIYMVIEALSDGGVKQGLSRNMAMSFAAQTVLGAAKMVLDSKKHPAQLKDEVCSAGGTTIHAVHALEKGNLRSTVMSAVEAAALRAEELGKLSKA